MSNTKRKSRLYTNILTSVLPLASASWLVQEVVAAVVVMVFTNGTSMMGGHVDEYTVSQLWLLDDGNTEGEEVTGLWCEC